MKLIIILLNSFLIFSFSNAQTHYLFKNDTVKTVFKKLRLGSVVLETRDFSDSLIDGEWKYFYTEDSLEKYYQNLIRIEGVFLNNKKHGRFVYYYEYLESKKNKPIPDIIVNYQNGKLDGLFIIYDRFLKSYEGFYTEGKRNGFFISYFDKKQGNGIKQIEYFKNDTLKNWITFNAKGIIIYSGSGEGISLDGEFIMNDSLGIRKYSATFNNGILNSYEEYNQFGFLNKRLVGEFESTELIAKQRTTIGQYFIDFNKLKLINGAIYIYKKDSIFSIENYRNGIRD